MRPSSQIKLAREEQSKQPQPATQPAPVTEAELPAKVSKRKPRKQSPAYRKARKQRIKAKAKAGHKAAAAKGGVKAKSKKR